MKNETWKWMRVMEARYQVSSVLFVTSAHLGDERHDEAIATPSALSYLNAVESFDATQEVAKMGAALRGDEVLGGALLNPELRNPAHTKSDKELRFKSVTLYYYTKALNIVQKASGLTVTSPQRVEWGRLCDYGLRLITTPSIPGDIISKRSKNSKELDLVTDGFIMEKIRFEVIQRPNSQRGVSPLTISHDEEPPSISAFSSSALNESPLATSNLSFAVPTSNEPIPSTSTSSFISQPAPPTLAAAVAVPGVQRGRKRKARKAATDHRKRPGGVSLRSRSDID
ncbi:hypothetical protein J007_00169 [Cryptococcus neoformans]|nr:hypothetical protein J007_00169 [Cryptococcus neoformans var. grubii]